MPCVTQPFVQFIALLKTAGALTYFQDFRLDLCNEGCRTSAIVEPNEITNVNEVCPRGGQDNDICHNQDWSA